jgi:hypothetical protein
MVRSMAVPDECKADKPGTGTGDVEADPQLTIWILSWTGGDRSGTIGTAGVTSACCDTIARMCSLG